jgi:hypothetical protein
MGEFGVGNHVSLMTALVKEIIEKIVNTLDALMLVQKIHEEFGDNFVHLVMVGVVEKSGEI